MSEAAAPPTPKQRKRIKVIGVGMPAALHLDYFGFLVHCAFGHYPYLVGSALQSKTWRDVDVRLTLPDDEYESLRLGKLTTEHTNPRWVAWTMAFSALGKQLTGLPIDFQIQQRSDASRFDGPRYTLGLEHSIMNQNRTEEMNREC